MHDVYSESELRVYSVGETDAYFASSTLPIIMSEAQQHDDQDKISRETEHSSNTQQQAGNNDMDLGSMIHEAQEKGVKGALLSRLKKAKIGKVNLDPAIGMS